MNRTCSFALVALVLALIIAASGFPAPSAAMVPAGGNIPLVYDLLDLGSVRSASLAMNAAGQVVGSSDYKSAFFYDGAAFVPLPVPDDIGYVQAMDLNASGEAVGYYYGSASGQLSRAVHWHNGQRTELSPPGASQSAAFGIDDGGRIVGTAWPLDFTDYNRPVLWDGSSVVDLTPPGEEFGVAQAIVTSGNIAGVSGLAPGFAHATLWRDGTAINLGVPPGFQTSWAEDINGDDWVVGYASGGTDYFFYDRAFLWRDGETIDLGTLGGDQSVARGVNEAGQIVGWAENAAFTQRAVLWDEGRAIDLNTRIPADSGWTLNDAQNINDSGQIVGFGWYNDDIRAFRLTPRTSPDATRALALASDGPGTVTADPTGATHPSGATVNFNASAAPGAVFAGWEVDGAFIGWGPTLALTMDIDHVVRAVFLAGVGFADVPTGDPVATAVAQLAARGVVQGYGGGHYGPSEPLRRAELAAIVVRMLFNGKPFGGPDDRWFDDRCNADGCLVGTLWVPVNQLATYGLVRGYHSWMVPSDERKFGPLDPVSQLDTITIITRAMVFKRLWVWQPDNAGLYPNVPRAAGETILATWVHYAGAPPGAPASGPWADWSATANRGWAASALWQAADSHYGAGHAP